MLDSSHSSSKRSQSPGVDVALNPDELQEGIDTNLLSNKYEQHLQVSKRNTTQDLSDVAAEHTKKEAKRKQKKEDKKDPVDKKYGSKVFKF